MIPLPYNVRVGVNGGTKSLVFETIPEVVKFLTSEESDYMYSESQMDVPVFAILFQIVSYRMLHCVALSITAVKNIFSPNISFNSIYSAIINQHISHISNPIIYNIAW